MMNNFKKAYKSSEYSYKTVERSKLNLGSIRSCQIIEKIGSTSNLKLLTSVNLCKCDLKTLPESLFEFQLKELDLSHNKLVDVPECLLKCKYLEKLDFSWNKLKNFDSEPDFVQKLRYLNLEHNRMVNIPDWILNVKCFNLEELFYSFNKIEELTAAKFNKVSHYELKTLELLNCYLIDADLTFLKSIRTLKILDISNNELTSLNSFIDCNELFNNPAWYKTIVVLKLNNLQLPTLSSEIKCLSSLKELEVAHNILMWLPESISEMDNLRLLDVSYNKLLYFPKTMYRFKKLEVIKASFNKLTDLRNMCSLENLLYLDLYENELDSFELNIKTLKYLDLERNILNTSEFNSQFLDSYKNIKYCLRSLESNSRCDGPKQLLSNTVDYRSDETSECESEYSENDINSVFKENINNYTEIENWDEERSIPENGCTESDNEWKGCGENTNLLPVVHSKKKFIEEWPSYLFEDVIE